MCFAGLSTLGMASTDGNWRRTRNERCLAPGYDCARNAASTGARLRGRLWVTTTASTVGPPTGATSESEGDGGRRAGAGGEIMPFAGCQSRDTRPGSKKALVGFGEVLSQSLLGATDPMGFSFRAAGEMCVTSFCDLLPRRSERQQRADFDANAPRENAELILLDDHGSRGAVERTAGPPGAEACRSCPR